MDKGIAVIAMGGLALAGVAMMAGKASASPGGGGGGGPVTTPCGTMDPGIDSTTAAAVCQAIGQATGTAQCATLNSFAASIKTKWPQAAALLTAKATALGCPPPSSSGGVCAPGASILGQLPAAAEDDIAYALAAWINASDVLTNTGVTSDLSWWVNPSGQTQGGKQAGGGGTPPTEAPAPFRLESGVHYVTDAQISASGANTWITPATGSWPTYMTAQAVDINTSSAPDGVYYVCDGVPGGMLYQMTKSAGNTTLKVAQNIPDWTQIPGSNETGGGSNPTPSTAQTLLGDIPGKFAVAIDSLQQLAKLEGLATLPGAAAGVLDAQTLIALAGWIIKLGLADITAGTASSILGQMQKAFPGVVSWAQAGCQGAA